MTIQRRPSSSDPPPPGTPAALYIRVSTGRQAAADRHSPDVQRTRLLALAVREGWPVALVRQDVGRRHNLTREGYQDIIAAVRKREIGVVLVYMHDRLSSGIEWLSRLQEFDALGVPVVSEQEGASERGMLRFVRAGMQYEESLRLARRVGPARIAGARTGTHMGRTPYGYRRVYPQRQDATARPAGQLVPHEPEVRVVRDLYRWYLDGASTWSLALRLNEETVAGRAIPAPHGGGLWGETAVYTILRSPVYAGRVRYGQRPSGAYEPGDPVDVFVAEGRHEAVVDEEMWRAVQARLSAGNRRGPLGTRSGPRLGSGLLRCATCGAATIFCAAPRPDPSKPRRAGMYECGAARRGAARCQGVAINARAVHAAIRAELGRLTVVDRAYRPRRVAAEPDRARQTTARLTAEIATAERDLDAINRSAALTGELSAEQVASWRRLAGEAETHLMAARAQLQGVGQQGAVHRQTRDQVRQVITAALPAALRDADDDELIPLTRLLIRSACVMERVPAINTRWCRLDVEWSPLVVAMMADGDVTLAPPEPTPTRTARQEDDRLKARRYRERRRTQAVVTPTETSG